MDDLEKAVNSFEGIKIISMGDVMLDKHTWGKIRRKNPEHESAPLINVIDETFVMGGAANVANNLSAMGASCTLYGIIGTDSAGSTLSKMLPQKKIKPNLFKDSNPTIIKQRVMANGEQKIRIDYDEGDKRISMDREIENEIIMYLEEDLRSSAFLILSDYNKKFFSENFSQKIIKLAIQRGIPILVDPKEKEHVHYFKGCTIVRPNLKESQEITGIKYSRDLETLTKMAHRLSEIFQSEYSVITCGEDGAFSYDKNAKKGHMIETKPVKKPYHAGAGDTFVSGLVLGMSYGLNVHDASELGTFAARSVVKKPGVATTSTEEVLAEMKKDQVYSKV